MNRFFRSALFPLVVIVLLVWLASQTLIPHGKSAEKATYSDFISAAKQGQVNKVEFTPSKRQITYINTAEGDKKVTVHYPADQSVPQITEVLQEHPGITFDSKRSPTRLP